MATFNPVSIRRPFLTTLAVLFPSPVFSIPTNMVHFFPRALDFVPCLLDLITYCLSSPSDCKFHENRVHFCFAHIWVLTMHSKLTSILWYQDTCQVLNAYLLNQWTKLLPWPSTNHLNSLGLFSTMISYFLNLINIF